MNGAYQEPVNEAHPLLFVIALDPSLAASPERVVAEVNRFLYGAIMRCVRGETIRNAFYISLLGASDEVQSAFAGQFAGREVVPIGELAEHPLRIAIKTRQIDDGVGGIVEVEERLPEWFDSILPSNVAQAELLRAAEKIAADYMQASPESFPPMVVHLTDGMAPPDPGAVREAGEAIKSVKTALGGSALLFHLSANRTADPFWASESSSLPRSIQDRFPKQLAYSEDLCELLSIFAVGTRPSSHTYTAEISRPLSPLDVEKRLSEVRSVQSDAGASPRGIHAGVTEAVCFAVAGPPCLQPGSGAIFDVWAYLSAQRAEMLLRAREEASSPDVQIKSKGPVQLPRGSDLQIEIRIEGCQVSPEVECIQWLGEITNAQFDVFVPHDVPPGRRTGRVSVGVDGVTITKVLFDVVIGATAAPAEFLPERQKDYRRVFASYASDDRDAVLGRLQGIYKVRPDLDVFLDVARLRAGQRWEEQLYQEIAGRDSLYLFWSLAASRSPWVDREWRFALAKHGIEFIDPVPLVSPQEAPPPSELASLHFNDWLLAFRK